MKFIFFIFLFLSPVALFSQSEEKSNFDLKAFVEKLFPVQEEDLDYELIYEALFQLFQEPLDLNNAEPEELQATYLLSPNQLQNFLDYRGQFGPFISMYELQSIPEFDLPTILNLLPFITIQDEFLTPKKFLQRLAEEKNSYLIVRHRRTLEKRRGFIRTQLDDSGTMGTPYLGDQNELYTRLRIQKPRDFSLGFTLEKDAGEQFKWDKNSGQYGFNFASFHFTRQQVGKWKNLSFGDFQASFGQGLVFGAGYSLGKGSETVTTVRRSSRGLLPYSAAMEFGFFRGIGLTRQFKQWQTTLILSSAPRDGRLNSKEFDSEGSVGIISSLLQTGLHRTPAELSTKNQLREKNLGGNLSYSTRSGRWFAGVNLLLTQFSNPWIREKTPFNTFEFSGTKNQIGSIYANFNWKNFLLFGESASSKSGGKGAVLGFVSSLSKDFDFSLLWRSYERNFHSFYSSGFSENSRSINETGIYIGIHYKPSKVWKLNAYFDSFQFPWLKFRVYAPSKGYEWLAKLSYQPRKNLTAFFQVREEVKERNLADTGQPAQPYVLGYIQKINATLSLETRLTPNLFLRSRILWNQVEIERKKTFGLMVLQDVQFDSENWKISGRMAIFDSDSYDNRLYSFENNVLWTFAIPAFAGRGIRNYLLGQYQICPKLTAYLRIARTTYTDREEISSGLQTIDGNKQSETTLLLRYFLH